MAAKLVASKNCYVGRGTIYPVEGPTSVAAVRNVVRGVFE